MADYNGWTNRSTWLVVLWAENDEFIYRLVMPVIKRWALRKATGSPEYTPKKAQAAVKAIMENSGAVAAAKADFGRGRFGGVNWREIADSLIGDEVDEIKRRNS